MTISLLTGLGNPGRKYRQTRHNVGFLVIDGIAAQVPLAVKKKKFQARYELAELFGKKICLVKPETYMNLSGEAVKAFCNYLQVAPADLLVVHDDVDLPVGKLRFVFGSGAGGNRGVASIIEELATKSFYRLKLGVGRPPEFMETADYVLSKFTADEVPLVKEVIARAQEAVEFFYREGPVKAMRKYNGE